MRQFLAVAVLGTSLVLTASAAFADDRGVVEPVSRSTQNETIVNRTESVQSAVAGGRAAVSVDTNRENGGRNR